mmetsp:Transcript_5409/g.13103  ORF Transcript_5409/g.13103 Transcript_5409/m.13103 type:complete len:126 (-) Transcript_5409:18-395(-)
MDKSIQTGKESCSNSSSSDSRSRTPNNKDLCLDSLRLLAILEAHHKDSHTTWLWALAWEHPCHMLACLRTTTSNLAMEHRQLAVGKVCLECAEHTMYICACENTTCRGIHALSEVRVWLTDGLLS